jgi:hypothetical protein
MPLADEDETLVRLIGELADRTSGGGAGARFAGRRLKKDVHEIDLRGDTGPGPALARAEQLLTTHGTAHATDSEPGGIAAVQGVVRVGTGALNPAVVTIP